MPLTDRQRALMGPPALKRKGSIEWCWQKLEILKIQYTRLENHWEEFDDLLHAVEEVKAWQVIPPDRPYGSLDAMLRAELGVGSEIVRGRIAGLRLQHAKHLGEKAEKAPTHEEHPGGRGKKTGNDVTGFRGNDATYLARRLRRDYSEIADQMAAGKFPSVHAAALAAGLIKPTITIRIDDPLRAAHRLRKAFSPDDREILAKELTRPAEGAA